MTLIIILCLLFFTLIIFLSAFSYRALFFPHFRTAEFTISSGLERGEFDAAFMGLPWRGFEADSPHGYKIAGSMLASSRKTAPSALFVHGITWTRYGMFKYMRAFVDKGWNVAAIDLAGHGETRAPKRFSPSYGYYEKEDVAAALSELRKLFPDSQRIGLVGESLGAATSLQCIGMEASRLQDPPNFVIADCSFSGIAEELDYRLGRLRIPPWLRKPAEICVSFLAKVIRGFRLEEASPKNAACSSDIPVLFVHGIEDSYVPCAMSIAMYNARIMAGKSDTELLLVPGARHAKSVMTNPKLWEERAFAFIEAYSGS
ncbi:MAG: alpha/beta fold hydrolase [Spirochaetales bacterium]|jgi:hypothetical protein